MGAKGRLAPAQLPAYGTLGCVIFIMDILYVDIEQPPALEHLRTLVAYARLLFVSFLVGTHGTLLLEALPAHFADETVRIIVGGLVYPQGVSLPEALPADLAHVQRVDLEVAVVVLFVCESENRHLLAHCWRDM